jgi:hypothetical protein
MSTTPIESGALARTTQAFFEDGYAYGKGVEFEVEEYATAEEADASHGYYMGNQDGGFNNMEVREDHAELVRSAADMNARTIPTPAELAEHIASESLGGFDIDLDQADYSAKDGTFEVYGKTADGLRFGATVRVLSVERTDF